MQETRRARLQTVILEEISLLVSREVKDPRIPTLTFTKVEVTPDASQATLYFTFFGAMSLSPEAKGGVTQADKDAVRACLDGLASCAGFLRRHLAKALTTRNVPSLIFKYDRGLENVSRVHELLSEIKREGGGAETQASDAASGKKSDGQ